MDRREHAELSLCVVVALEVSGGDRELPVLDDDRDFLRELETLPLPPFLGLGELVLLRDESPLPLSCAAAADSLASF